MSLGRSDTVFSAGAIAILCSLASAVALRGAPEPSPSPTPSYLVDRYGQNARVALANRVMSDEELKADAAKQRAALQPLDSPATDSYGGLAGSREKFGLRKTGFFRVDTVGNRSVLVTPEGNIFFHLGVCGIAMTDDYTLVTGRERDYEWLPPKQGEFATAWRPKTPGVVSFYIANWIKKFGKPFDPEEWSGQVVDRLRAWGFNSAGAFSDYTQAMRERHFPYVSWLPMGQEFGTKMLPDRIGASEVIDPFVSGAEEALGKAFAKRIAPSADDPLLIGYFNGNEQHLELLPKLIPTYRASQVAAKQAFIRFLESKYHTIEAFNQAWQLPKPASSFEEAGEERLAISTESASADAEAFFRIYLETYFSLIERVFRKYDPHHLLIGNRLTPGTASNRDVVEISGRHLDVLSVNYYTYQIDSAFLGQAHEWSGGRPIILSEWYFSATDSGLGAGKEVRSQEERAVAYRHYVEQSAAIPYVVGSEWFIFNDQALTGRFFEGLHGEGNNTGLVNVADRPYERLVAATRETGRRIYDILLGRQAPFAFHDPRFSGGQGGQKTVAVPRALPGMKLDGSTTGWPGRPAEPIEPSRVVLGNPNPTLRGDFRLCWDDRHLYFLVQVKDPTPHRNSQPSDSLWNADAVELFLGTRDPVRKDSMLFGDTQIVIGAGDSPRVFIDGRAEDAARCRAVLIPDVSRDGYTLEAAIPWAILKFAPQPGATLLFDVAIDNSDDGKTRRQQLMWNGTARNSGDRGAWGHARLVEN